MKRTGEILRREREARGLSLHEIGLSLKINSKILKAIEEGDTTQLPAKTFLRGFVQSYASYLKLNVDEVLKVFAEEMGTTRPQPAPPPVKDETPEPEVVIPPPVIRAAPPLQKEGGPKPPPKNIEQTSTTKGLIFAIAAVVLAGLITVTVKIIEKYQREAQVATVDVKPIEQPTESPAPVESTAPVEQANQQNQVGPSLLLPGPTNSPVATVPSPSPSPSASASPTPTPSVTPTPSPTPTVAAVVVKPTPTPTPSVKPTPTPTAKPTPTPSPTPSAKPTPTPSPTPSPSPSPTRAVKSIELIVEALDNVEIEYSSGAGKVDKTTLAAGQIHTFKSNSGLKLNINNGGAVNIILNGKDVGVPGDLGKPIKLSY